MVTIGSSQEVVKLAQRCFEFHINADNSKPTKDSEDSREPNFTA